MDETASTAVPSQIPSEVHLEKESRTPSVKSNVSHDISVGHKTEIETTAEKEMKADDKLSDEVEYPGGLKLAIIMVALCLAVFLVALDNTIIATAIPRITDQFHALNDVGYISPADCPLIETLLTSSAGGMHLPTFSPPAPSSSCLANSTRSSASNGCS